MDLKTSYLGFELEHPLVPSASPLTGDLETLKQLEDAGASMVVLRSLFEEQIKRSAEATEHYMSVGTETFAESLTYFPSCKSQDHGKDEYLELVRKSKESLSIPVVASLNGVDAGGWTDTAALIQQAGADALELNIYYIPTDLNQPGVDVEAGYLEILKKVKSTVNVPLTVKLSPFFSSIPNMARQLADAGANGMALFNRFYQPDIQIEELEHVPQLTLSDSGDLRLPLRWISIIYGRVSCDLAVTSGIHTVEDVIKAVMAGACVTHLCSGLLKNGPGLIGQLQKGVATWLEEHEYTSLRQMLGSMSQIHCPNPSALERANYMETLYSW